MTEAALRCIHEFEQRAWRFGVPCTTRHAYVEHLLARGELV